MQKLCFVVLVLLSYSTSGQPVADSKKTDLAFYGATQQWFNAWTLVSKNIYQIHHLQPVEFVFFDDSYVYSTSAITVPHGTAVKGPDLMNLRLVWKKALHHDTLILPDQSVVPVNLMSFAAETAGKNQAFFVMPLPSFWKQAGVSSKELGLNNLITGVFIHEFSHAQQMQNFGKKMTAYENQNSFEVPFSDDIVQTLFDNDSAYLTAYKKETHLLYASLANNTLNKDSLRAALLLLAQRQSQYLRPKNETLPEIDHFFLTMEGLGQYSMFLWLTHPQGARIKRELAIEGVRRGKKWWSQDEGFALFLVLDKLSSSKQWAQNMFGTKTESVIQLISNYLQ